MYETQKGVVNKNERYPQPLEKITVYFMLCRIKRTGFRAQYPERRHMGRGRQSDRVHYVGDHRLCLATEEIVDDEKRGLDLGLRRGVHLCANQYPFHWHGYLLGHVCVDLCIRSGKCLVDCYFLSGDYTDPR